MVIFFFFHFVKKDEIKKIVSENRYATYIMFKKSFLIGTEEIYRHIVVLKNYMICFENII